MQMTSYPLITTTNLTTPEPSPLVPYKYIYKCDVLLLLLLLSLLFFIIIYRVS